MVTPIEEPFAKIPLMLPVIGEVVTAVLPFTTVPAAFTEPFEPKLIPSSPPLTVPKLLTPSDPELIEIPVPVVPLPPMILAVFTAALPFTTVPLAPTVPLLPKPMPVPPPLMVARFVTVAAPALTKMPEPLVPAPPMIEALVSAALPLAMLPPPPREIPPKVLAVMDAKLVTPIEPFAKIPLMLPVIREVVTAVLPFTTVPAAFTEPFEPKLIPSSPPLTVPKLLTPSDPELIEIPVPVVPLPPMILAVFTAALPFTTVPLAPTVPLLPKPMPVPPPLMVARFVTVAAPALTKMPEPLGSGAADDRGLGVGRIAVGDAATASEGDTAEGIRGDGREVGDADRAVREDPADASCYQGSCNRGAAIHHRSGRALPSRSNRN